MPDAGDSDPDQAFSLKEALARIEPSEQDQLQELNEHAATNEAIELSNQQTTLMKDEQWLELLHNPFASYLALDSVLALVECSEDAVNYLIAPVVSKTTKKSFSWDPEGVLAKEYHIKAYSGPSPTQVNWKKVLDCPPSCITSLYTNEAKVEGLKQLPTVAIACGNEVLLYRNFRQCGVLIMPSWDFNVHEQGIWHRFFSQPLPEDLSPFIQELEHLANRKDVVLSPRCEFLLQLSDREERIHLIPELHAHQDVIFEQKDFPTCMTTLKRAYEDEGSASYLVIGTEYHRVLVYDAETCVMLKEFRINDAAVSVSASGLYEVDYFIVVADRDGNIYLLSNDVCKVVTSCETSPIAVLAQSKYFFAATMSNQLIKFSLNGKRPFVKQYKHTILALAPFHAKSRGLKGVIVSLGHSEVHIFIHDALVSILHLQEPAAAIHFGTFGLEPDCFVCIGVSGGLTVRKLKPDAIFKSLDHVCPPPEQDIPLPLPAKTSLFLENINRERREAKDMYRMYERDMFLLKLNTMRLYVKSIKQASSTMNSSSDDLKVNMDIEIIGIGPLFTLRLLVQNISSAVITRTLYLAVHADPVVFIVDPSLSRLPALVPNVQYTFEVKLKHVHLVLQTDQVDVILSEQGRTKPLLLMTLTMPVTQLQPNVA